MRILQIARRFVADHWGGTETVISQISGELINRSHDTELWTSSALSKPGKDFFAGLSIRRFPYIYPYLGLSSKTKAALDYKGGNLFSPSMMAALLLSAPFDIYHLHTGKRFGAQAAVAARLYNRPYVISLHGGHTNVPEGEAKELLAPTTGKLEWGKAIGAILGSRSLLRRADAIIAVDPSEVDTLSQQYPETKVLHLPNGVNIEGFSGADGADFRARHSIPKNEKVIGCISRIDPQKGQLELMEAIGLIHNQGKHKPHLVLIGPETDTDYAASVHKAAKSMRKYIHILPPLSSGTSDLSAAFSSFDIFALASRHEPFGIVVLEAWASNLPVVAHSVGGLSKIIANESNGLLVPGKEGAAGMATAIARLLDNQTFATELADAGFRTAKTSYSWPVIVDNLLDLYNEVIERRNR